MIGEVPAFKQNATRSTVTPHQVISPKARSFLLGRSGPVKRLVFSNSKMYGRQNQIVQLKNAYEHARSFHDADKALEAQKVVSGDSGFLTLMRKLSSSNKKSVFISGAAGTGKSALVEAALCQRVKQTGGLYASGKFDLQRIAEPYMAIDMAFSQLLRDMVHRGAETNKMTTDDQNKSSSNNEAFRRIQDSIRKLVVAEGGDALLSILPSLHTLFVDQDDENSKITSLHRMERKKSFVLGNRAKHKSHFAFQRLINCICRELPLVLVLDDLQWADVSSLELLEAFLTSHRTIPGNCLLVGCYRDGEQEGEEFGQMFARLEQTLLANNENDAENPDDENGRLHIIKVQIGNLELGAVRELVVDALDWSASSDDGNATSSLARIVHNKTAGNVFFVKEYLKSLVDTKLLKYQWVTAKWNWDLDKIVSNTTVTDNVVDLMRNKMCQQLTVDCQNILRVAACLGANFNESMLELIFNEMDKMGLTNGLSPSVKDDDSDCDDLPNTTRHRLDVCVEEGLIVRSGNETSSGYQFVHDQVQQAAFSLIPEHERDVLQYRIGKALADNLSHSELKENLFVTVDLLNVGVKASLVKDTKRKFEFAKRNKEAGEKAMRSSAFAPAAAYLNQAISLLETEHWEKQYAFSLELYSAASEAAYSSGNLNQLEKLVSEIAAQKDRPIVDKLRAYRALLEALGSQNKFDEAINLSRNILGQLGVKFPRFGQKFALLPALVKVNKLLKGRSVDSLVELPLMQDEKKVGASRILDKLGSFSYSKGLDITPLLVLKMLRWSIRYGVFQDSPIAFVSYGFILGSALGDFKRGHEFGKVALRLIERLKAKKIEARILFLMHTLVNHWVAPVHTSLKPLFHAYNVGLETGDIESAMASISVRCYFAMISGQPLADVEVDLRVYSRQMRDVKSEYVLLYMLPSWQFVLNMMGKSNHPEVLTGDVMDVEALLKQAAEKKNWNAVTFIKLTQLSLACYLDEFEVAGSLIEQTQDIAKTCFASSYVWRHAYYEGLTAFALARKTNSRRWKTRARRAQQRIERWTRSGNVNCLHMHHLFNAESASLQNISKDEVRNMYDLAISTSGRCGILQDQAIANERAGEFFVASGDKYWAAHYLDQAHRLYTDWGAFEKGNLLKRKHPGHL